MWLADRWKDYEVIDCSCGEKLERWSKYILSLIHISSDCYFNLRSWDVYCIMFCSICVTNSCKGLVAEAGLKVPYAPGCIREIGEAISTWIDANPL